jgi:hypothetical protein
MLFIIGCYRLGASSLLRRLSVVCARAGGSIDCVGVSFRTLRTLYPIKALLVVEAVDVSVKAFDHPDLNFPSVRLEFPDLNRGAPRNIYRPLQQKILGLLSHLPAEIGIM